MTLLFYVLKKGGILLYSKQVIIEGHFINPTNPLLIAGFLSAIEIFAKEFVDQSVEIIEMGNFKLRFSSQNDADCFFCLVYQKNNEEQKYKYLLNTLELLFTHKFRNQIKKNPSNLTYFKRFDPFLDLVLRAFEIENKLFKIEHFLCGFIGEFRDFQYKSGLKCPKCKKLINQEGIDYRIKKN